MRSRQYCVLMLSDFHSIRYDGNPLRARKGQYLSFEKDERLEILDQSDSEWWEVGVSLITRARYFLGRISNATVGA